MFLLYFDLNVFEIVLTEYRIFFFIENPKVVLFLLHCQLSPGEYIKPSCLGIDSNIAESAEFLYQKKKKKEKNKKAERGRRK